MDSILVMKPDYKIKWLDHLNRVVVAIALTAFVGMLLSTWAQVLFRKFGVSVDWTEELARVLFLCSVFLSIAIALHESKHIVVDFLFNRLPPRIRSVVQAGFHILIFLFLVSLLRGSLKMTSVTWETYMISMNWMRTGYLYMMESFAIALMMIFLAGAFYQNLRKLKNTPIPNPDEGEK